MTDASFPAPVLMDRQPPWGVWVSLGLHVGLAALALWLSPLRQLVVPPPASVTVEIITPAEFAALQPPEPATPVTSATPQIPLTPAPAGDLATPSPDARLAPAGPLAPDLPKPAIVTATRFFAGDLLKQPGMQRIRQKLTSLADSERMVQVCNIEAIEQIKRAAADFDPDTVVPYAMGDPLWNGLLFIAPSGAFRSRRRWYELAFHCTVAPDYEAVTAFDFLIGTSIPEAEWEERSLTAEDKEE